MHQDCSVGSDHPNIGKGAHLPKINRHLAQAGHLCDLTAGPRSEDRIVRILPSL
jgi:hypothetical protein